MSGIIQEKFQYDYPGNANDDSHGGWVSDKSARVKKGAPGREGRAGGDPATQKMNNAVFYGSLPPGMDIEDQEMTDQRVMKMTMSGESDVSQDWNAGAIKNGFTKREMRPTDDQYTREHDDAFYDDVGGFVERNNMLDRL
jgi:hypothetical protein